MASAAVTVAAWGGALVAVEEEEGADQQQGRAAWAEDIQLAATAGVVPTVAVQRQ
jgi:hypothetical protein